MIEVEHLTKSYGPVKAVRDVSFRVDKGEVVGFLGPNGAGKSTTLRILAGFLGATAGRVRIAGHDTVEEPMEARASIGYMPEMAPLYPEMRVAEYLGFRAELKGLARKARKGAVARALTDAGLDDMADVMIGHLSKGYRQRVGLADALVGSPPLLILDEPTAGLDPNQIRDVRTLIRRLGGEHTVLLSTHILSEVEATCTRAVVIARGRLVAEGSIDAILAMRRSSGIRLRLRGAPAPAEAAARKVPGVARTEVDAGAGESPLITMIVEFERGIDGPRATEALVGALVEAGIGVREVMPRTASLEQIFSDLTTTTGDAAPADAAPESARARP
jgi:ABC-2 type transport system ATP-binding protein